MAQQTAVEWLKDNIQNAIMCDHIGGLEYWDKETLLEFIEQAKQMEKEQHENTWIDSRIESNMDDSIGKEKTFQQYFNETYGK